MDSFFKPPNCFPVNAASNPTDAELVAALNRGDKKAFEIIYRTYVSPLTRYARKNIYTKEDCEEIIQEIFESLWARHKTLRIEVLHSYLMKMVRYKIIRYYQHAAIKRKYAEYFILFEAVYNQLDHVDAADASPVQALIDKSITQLPGRCQAALQLRLKENLSNVEIAKRMNISKKTVENYIVMALNHLRTSFPGSMQG